MSQDIRRFFLKSPESSVQRSKLKSKVISLSSDEDDGKSKASSKRPKVLKKSSRQHVLSDSDEEVTVVKDEKKKLVKEKKTIESLKPVAALDLFSTKPVKRVKDKVIKKELTKKEAEYHDDDDFDATLSQLDTSQIEAEFLKTIDNDASSNSKRKHSEESDEETNTKKVRRDDSAYDDNNKNRTYSEDKKRGNGNSSNSSEKSKNIENKDEKKVHSRMIEMTNDKEDRKTTKDSSASGKLKFGNIKRKNISQDIVFEKNDTTIKCKKEEQVSDVYEENIEKKKQRLAAYNKYLQRGGARNPGSKEIPEGVDGCLVGLTFLITGVLDSLEREEAEELIQKYGGRSVKSLSKKTDYMIVGDEAGASKLEKAMALGTKQISEDQLLELIKTRSAGKSNKNVQAKNSSKNENRSKSRETVKRSPMKKTETVSSPVQVKSPPKKVASTSHSQEYTDSGFHTQSSMGSIEDVSGTPTGYKGAGVNQIEALVEKYRPKTIKQIIGQQGDKSNANKLYTWLSNWDKNQNGSVKRTKPGLFAKNDDGGFFKACLLSGPPGVGKTTTAQVVCAELKFDLIEFNASDTRSKRLLKEEVAGILSNTTVKGYFGKQFNQRLSKKHVLLMDEVDGMAGNEDRGGLQELISLIKSSEVPIICICNDRNHPKMRTLSNYTFDLRFQKPRLEQIRGAMKSICCREKINATTEDIDRLIQSTNQDIRQVINHLAMLSAGSFTDREKTKTRDISKDLRLGPWDVVRKVFSAEEHEKMSIHDKSDLFFHDYNIAGLFVQENYLSVVPKAPRTELLGRIARSAESLAMGDLIENAIRRNGAWSLLPTQACFSSVIPGTLMSGRLTAQANFPAWLGRNSTRGKFDRLLQEITVHTRLATGASKEAMNIDYLVPLRDAIVRPLALRNTDGIQESLNVMNKYHLLREDLESLVEVSLWPGGRDPMQAVDSKTKAAFTRTYNKTAAPAPYLINAAPKKKASQASQDDDFMDGEDEDVASDVDNDDMGSDRMIKAKKPTEAKNTGSTSKTEGKPTKRGRGRGKAK